MDQNLEQQETKAGSGTKADSGNNSHENDNQIDECLRLLMEQYPDSKKFQRTFVKLIDYPQQTLSRIKEMNPGEEEKHNLRLNLEVMEQREKDKRAGRNDVLTAFVLIVFIETVILLLVGGFGEYPAGGKSIFLRLLMYGFVFVLYNSLAKNDKRYLELLVHLKDFVKDA